MTNFMAVAKKAAVAAGDLLMRHYGKLKNSQIHTKSKNDFVTAIDKKSEEVIISTIKKKFPRHGFLAEESGSSRGNEIQWIIDPLDGTSNYIHQIPLFTVSIAALKDGAPLVRPLAGQNPEQRPRPWAESASKDQSLEIGVVYDPVHREMFSAEKGRGAFLNNKPIRVTKVKTLSQALLATGIPFRARGRFEEYFASLKKISLASVGIRRGGSAAMDLAYVACGRFDGFWEINLSSWDIAAGTLLIEEAGGKVTDLWGGTQHLACGDILASNALVHQELRRITSRIFTRCPSSI